MDFVAYSLLHKWSIYGELNSGGLSAESNHSSLRFRIHLGRALNIGQIVLSIKFGNTLSSEGKLERDDRGGMR